MKCSLHAVVIELAFLHSFGTESSSKRVKEGQLYYNSMQGAFHNKLKEIENYMNEYFTNDGVLTVTDETIQDFLKPMGDLAVEFTRAHNEALQYYERVLSGVTNLCGSGSMKNLHGDLRQLAVIDQNEKNLTKISEKYTPRNAPMEDVHKLYKFVYDNMEHLTDMSKKIVDIMGLTIKFDCTYSARDKPKTAYRMAEKQLQKCLELEKDDLKSYILTDAFGWHAVADDLAQNEKGLQDLYEKFKNGPITMTTKNRDGKEKTWIVGIYRIKKNIKVHKLKESFTYIDDKINFHVTQEGTTNTIIVENIGLLQGDFDNKKESHGGYGFVRILHESMAKLVDDYKQKHVSDHAHGDESDDEKQQTSDAVPHADSETRSKRRRKNSPGAKRKKFKSGNNRLDTLKAEIAFAREVSEAQENRDYIPGQRDRSDRIHSAEEHAEYVTQRQMCDSHKD
jgi:hypothetical protein